MFNETIQILLLAGSAERPSHARANLEAFESLLKERGANTYLWDLYDDPLPIFNPIYYSDPGLNRSEAVRRLAQLAIEADGFVWASPNYHNSYSGVLKNALDSLTSAQFHDKPVALMSTGHSDRTAVQPCDQLRIVARGLLAVAIPTQVVTITSDFKLSQGSYTLTNDNLHERLVYMADEFLAYAVLMRHLHSRIIKG